MTDELRQKVRRAIAAEVAKFTPPAAITGTSLFGLDWPHVVYILTAIYTVFQICGQFARAVAWWKKRKAAKREPVHVPPPAA